MEAMASLNVFCEFIEAFTFDRGDNLLRFI